MIDNSVIWRGASSVAENVATPQVAKSGDPDNQRSGISSGAAFEAYIFEIAGVKRQTGETPVQNGRQTSYSQDSNNGETASTAQGDELPNSPRTQSAPVGLRSDENIGNSSSISGLYGNGRRTAAIRAQGSALWHDDSEDPNMHSQDASATNPGRNLVASAALRRAGISNTLTNPARHQEVANASLPSLTMSPAIVAGQVQNAATNSAGTDPSSNSKGTALGSTVANTSPPSLTVSSAIVAGQVQNAATNSTGTDASSNSGGTAVGNTEANASPPSLTVFPAIVAGQVQYAAANSAGTDPSFNSGGTALRRTEANASPPSLTVSPTIVAGQVQIAATNSAGTDPSSNSKGTALGSTVANASPPSLTVSPPIAAEQVQIAATNSAGTDPSSNSGGTADGNTEANVSPPSLTVFPAIVAGEVQNAATKSAGADASSNSEGTTIGNTEGWRSAGLQSAGANADPTATVAAMQSQGAGFSKDDSEESNTRSHDLSATDPGQDQGAPAALRRAGISNSWTIQAKNHEDGDAAPPSPSPSVSAALIAAVAAQGQSAAANVLGTDPSSAAEGAADNIVSTVSSGLSSLSAVTGEGRGVDSDRRDNNKGLAFVSGSNWNGATDLLSSMVTDNATLGNFKNERSVSANLASVLPETMPKTSTSHLTDVKAQVSNEINTPTVGVSVIGQTTSFAPPVTSFSIHQVADPIISACRTNTSDNSATGASVPTNALVKTLEIRLSPESLGAVTVKINLSGGALDIQVVADHQETLRLLRDNKDLLSQSIQSSGYKLDALTLEGSASQGGSLGGQTSPGQGHHFGFQSSAQGSSLGSSQQGENRSRDQSQLEKGREATSGEPSSSRAPETGADNRSGAVYV